MQITLETEEFFALLSNQQNICQQIQALQSSVNELLAGGKSIMSSLAALTAVDQAIDAAVTALAAEEGSLVTAIQGAVTFIEGLVSSGSISSAQAAPIIADLQAQATNIQNVTAALTTAQSSLSSATAPAAGTSSTSSTTEPAPAAT